MGKRIIILGSTLAGVVLSTGIAVLASQMETGLHDGGSRWLAVRNVWCTVFRLESLCQTRFTINGFHRSLRSPADVSLEIEAANSGKRLSIPWWARDAAQGADVGKPVTADAFGFPLGQVVITRSARGMHWDVLPLGAIVNSLATGCIVYFVGDITVRATRHRRIRLGLCSTCRYPVQPGEMCPECGHTQPVLRHHG